MIPTGIETATFRLVAPPKWRKLKNWEIFEGRSLQYFKNTGDASWPPYAPTWSNGKHLWLEIKKNRTGKCELNARSLE